MNTQTSAQLRAGGGRVPADFTFSVRCHQDLTHRIGLKPVDEAYEVFYKMKAYCDALDGSVFGAGDAC